MLWVLKRTVSLRWFFWAPTTYVCWEKRKIIFQYKLLSGDLISFVVVSLWVVSKLFTYLDTCHACLGFQRTLQAIYSKVFVWFDSLLPIQQFFSVMSGRVFLSWTSTKQGLMCLAQGHSTMTPLRLEPATPLYRVKHSTTEPLRSLYI